MALDLSLTATKLLSSLASDDYVSIKREVGGVFDPVAGDTTGETLTQINLTAAVLSVNDAVFDGDNRLQFGDKMILADNKTAPLMSDVISFGGNDYKVVAIDGFNHAGTQQFYKVYCRG